jgi:hypothetical protein
MPRLASDVLWCPHLTLDLRVHDPDRLSDSFDKYSPCRKQLPSSVSCELGRFEDGGGGDERLPGMLSTMLAKGDKYLGWKVRCGLDGPVQERQLRGSIGKCRWFDLRAKENEGTRVFVSRKGGPRLQPSQEKLSLPIRGWHRSSTGAGCGAHSARSGNRSLGGCDGSVGSLVGVCHRTTRVKIVEPDLPLVANAVTVCPPLLPDLAPLGTTPRQLKVPSWATTELHNSALARWRDLNPLRYVTTTDPPEGKFAPWATTGVRRFPDPGVIVNEGTGGGESGPVSPVSTVSNAVPGISVAGSVAVMVDTPGSRPVASPREPSTLDTDASNPWDDDHVTLLVMS